MAGILVASLATGCESSEETNKRQVAACGQNLQCLSKLSEPTAHVFCKRPIERLTQYDMKWDEFGFADTRFSKITWKDMNHGIITYVGILLCRVALAFRMSPKQNSSVRHPTRHCIESTGKVEQGGER